MLIIKGELNKFKNSKFYDKDCWDYPKEEVEMLKDDENYSDIVYLLSEDRIYETNCDMHNLSQLLKEVNGEIYNFKTFEEKQKFKEIIKLFNEERDSEALNKLFDLTQDKMIIPLLKLYDEFEDEIKDYTTYIGEIYRDFIDYVWEKYNLIEVQLEIEQEEKQEQEEDIL